MEPSSFGNPLSISCENCEAVNDSSKKFCPQCSFPIGGTEDEKRSFRLIVSSRKRLLESANEKIKSAKYIIIAISAIVFLTGLYQGFYGDDFVAMIVNLIISLVYLILLAWCTKNPFGAILTAFIIYATVIVINAFFEPASLFNGIIIKIFFIVAFIKGIQSAKEAQGYLMELEKFKSAPRAE
ncbi:MAG: zinc ribbon domain-containing protein [Cyclobacteriaceae bacterium]|nr:MAG: zinc ribbon domain-containing protein [Cyclobacteriaceae bacterium]